MQRYVHIAHRLTGWNAVKNRVQQLNLELNDEEVKTVTNKIKNLSDIKQLTLDDVDNMLKDYHSALKDQKVNATEAAAASVAASASFGLKQSQAAMDETGKRQQ